MSSYLADTTIVVEMLRGNHAAKKFLEGQPEISQVTVAELIQGAQDKHDLRIVEKTVALLPQTAISAQISQLAIELLKKYNLSHGLLFLDALIAATAITKKLTLITANIKDFKFINHLETVSQQDILKN